MKVELSNEEMKDIYKNLAGIASKEARMVQEIEIHNRIDSVENYDKLKEDSSRKLELIIKLSKLIEW